MSDGGASTRVRMPWMLGYCDPWSVGPGETIRFMVGARERDRRYRATLVRLLSGMLCADGVREEIVAAPFNGEHDGVARRVPAGSFVLVDRPDAVAGLTRFTVQALVFPTLPGRGRQALVGTWSEGEGGQAFALLIDETGALALLLGDGAAGKPLSTGVPLTPNRWHHVSASVDLVAGRAFLRQAALPAHSFDDPPSAEREAAVPAGALAAKPLRLAAVGAPGPARARFATWHFNGKLEAPSLADRALTPDELRAAAAAGATRPPADATLAAWDFAAETPTARIVDLGPRRLDGITFNAPKRAATGARWDGAFHDWRQAPEHYGAIHFHDDDVHDSGWPVTFEWRVPRSQRSGVYALKLEAEGGPPFWITFFVRPARRARGDRSPKRAAFLASTATYQVYANYRSRMVQTPNDLARGTLTQIDPTDMLVMHMPELGGSTYDKHRDGSGVCHASRLRPMVNVRPTGWVWNFLIDLTLIEWLEAEGIPYDVITDDDVHRDGVAALEDFAVVLTGCHPEYWSLEMLDGAEAYLRRGGRFMYLGGNGFYWRISYPDANPGMIEVRRAEGGTRAWAEVPGENHHSSTGESGGLWRRNGRAPNRLVGVGFIAQGFDYASPYRRTPESANARAAWMFDGVEGEVFGDFGAAFGGAAGAEIDCASVDLGTPRHALVVASSEGHSRTMRLVVEEIGSAFRGAHGETWPGVKADITFFETQEGGAVWSTGSISYIGSLMHEGGRNPIGRLTGNVVRRFLDPAPFAMPGAKAGKR